MRINKKTIIIGASSSIGQDIVEAFVKNGHSVLGTGNSHPVAASDGVASTQLDLTSDQSIKDFRHYVAGRFPNPDCMVVLTGLVLGKNISEYSYAEIEQVLGVNFTGLAKLVASTFDLFQDQSQIIFLGSQAADRGSYDPIYAAAKGALVAFAKSLSRGLAPRTRVNVVAPSLIMNSRGYLDMPKTRREFHLRNTPTSSFIEKDELAQLVLNLTEKHWSHLNGTVVRLNGGSY